MRKFTATAARPSARIAQRAMSSSPAISIDCHTHMYTPKYMDILRKRTQIPRVQMIGDENRLIILPGEDDDTTTAAGRPIGEEYFDVNTKLAYMDRHNIDKSVISLANPWLDFLIGDEAENVAQELNDELEQMCEDSKGRLYGFATLPVRNTEACLREIKRLKSLPHIKGVVMGTPGAGQGLDHENMQGVLEAIEDSGYTIFLHPHYGVGTEHYHDSGHALFLALGFPFETTVCVSRLITSGMMDKVPNLKLLVAHAGAALPSLIGRLDSCVEHDHAICNRLQHKPSDYFKKMYFDAISYDGNALETLVNQVGSDRIVFGTDNPFFPPLHTDDYNKAEWPSTTKVYTCIDALGNTDTGKKILQGNAASLFDIKV